MRGTKKYPNQYGPRWPELPLIYFNNIHNSVISPLQRGYEIIQEQERRTIGPEDASRNNDVFMRLQDPDFIFPTLKRFPSLHPDQKRNSEKRRKRAPSLPYQLMSTPVLQQSAFRKYPKVKYTKQPRNARSTSTSTTTKTVQAQSGEETDGNVINGIDRDSSVVGEQMLDYATMIGGGAENNRELNTSTHHHSIQHRNDRETTNTKNAAAAAAAAAAADDDDDDSDDDNNGTGAGKITNDCGNICGSYDNDDNCGEDSGSSIDDNCGDDSGSNIDDNCGDGSGSDNDDNCGGEGLV